MYNLFNNILKARCYAGFLYGMHSCLSAYDESGYRCRYMSGKSCILYESKRFILGYKKAPVVIMTTETL